MRIQIYHNYADVIARQAHSSPDISSLVNCSIACEVHIVFCVEWQKNMHQLLILNVLPYSIWSNHKESVVWSYCTLEDLWDCVCSCLNSSFITKRTCHGKAWHLSVSHPNSERSQLLTILVFLGLDSSYLKFKTYLLTWEFFASNLTLKAFGH